MRRLFATLALLLPLLFVAGGALADTEPLKPTLEIPIPTVQFSNVQVQGSEGAQYIDIPWIGDYLSGLYKYGVAIAAFLAGIMMIVGGFQYLTAGGDATRAGAGKKRVTNAVIGLALSLGSYLILVTINPDLVSFNALHISVVKGIPFEVDTSGGKPGPGHGPADPAVVNGIIDAAKQLNIDACALLSICEHESGLRLRSWSGMYGGTGIDTATSYGPCQVWINNIREGTAFNNVLRSKFSDYPKADPAGGNTDQLVQAKKQWMLTNAAGSTFAGALILKAQFGPGGGTEALANFSAGSGSIQNWQHAHSCTPQAVSLKDASAIGVDAALKQACVPTAIVAIAGKEKAGKSACAPTYECADAKINSRAEFVGHCPGSDAPCYGMDAKEVVTYAIGAFPRLQQTYNCAK